MTAKNPQKQGRILEGGGEFSGWPEYITLHLIQKSHNQYWQGFGCICIISGDGNGASVLGIKGARHVKFSNVYRVG